MAKTMARDLARKLHDAGLIPGDLNDVSRVVLDLRNNELARLYVEYYADGDRWLDVIASEPGILVTTNAGTVTAGNG